MRVIGIAGKAGSGKNTFGGLLAGALVGLGYTVAVDAFATPIKQLAREVGWDGIKDDFGRKLLQTIGDMGRAKSTHHWVERLFLDRYGNSLSDFLIVTDVRYEAEAAAVLRSGHGDIYGSLVLLENRGGLNGETAQHSSETGLADIPETMWTYRIDNDITFEQLVMEATALAVKLVSVTEEKRAARDLVESLQRAERIEVHDDRQ